MQTSGERVEHDLETRNMGPGDIIGQKEFAFNHDSDYTATLTSLKTNSGEQVFHISRRRFRAAISNLYYSELKVSEDIFESMMGPEFPKPVGCFNNVSFKPRECIYRQT